MNPRSGLLATASGRRLLVVSLIDSAGNGAYVTAGVVLFSAVLHLSAAQVGQGFALGSGVGLALSVGWGMLADRLGVRPILFTLLLWRATGCVVFVFTHSFAGYLAAVVFLGIAERASQPIMLAFVIRAVDESVRVRAAATLRSLRNAGYLLGALAAALALAWPGRTSLAVVMLGNAASFVVAVLLLRRMPLRPPPAATPETRAGGESVLRRPAFLVTTALSGALGVHRQILAVGLPLWIVTRHLAPSSTISILVAVNTTLVVLLQVRMVRNADDAAGGARVLRRSGWALLALAAVLAVSAVDLPGRPWSMIGLLLVAAAVLTFAEMWHAAGAWGISLALAPARAQSRFLTAFGVGASAQDIYGAVLITSLVLPAGAAGWLVLGGVLAGAGLLAPPVAGWAERERVRAETVVPAGDRRDDLSAVGGPRPS